MQVERQITGRLKTFLGILLQAMAHDVIKRRRYPAIASKEICRIFLEDGAGRVRWSRPRKCPPAREHFIEHCTEGKNVGTSVGLLPPHLFWGHVSCGAHDHALSGARGF